MRDSDVRVWRSSDLPVEVLVASKCQHLYRVYHDTFTLCVVADTPDNRLSRAEWWYRGRECSIGAGGVMLFEPGHMHVTRSVLNPADFRVLFIDADWVQQLGEELGLGPAVHFRVAQITSQPILVNALDRLARNLEDPRVSALEREAGLVACMRGVLSLAAEIKSHPRRETGAQAPRAARDYLHAHVADPVSLSDLAQLQGMSRFHLIREFKKAYGLSPHAYHLQLRLTAARRQLRSGVRASEVEVGFSEQSLLTRHFTRALGMTPNRYRLGGEHKPVGAPLSRPCSRS